MKRRNRYGDDVTHSTDAFRVHITREDEDIIATFGIGKG